MNNNMSSTNKFRQIDEGFDYVFKAETTDEQITRLKNWSKTNQALIPIVRIGVGAEKPDWGLPSGEPETMKWDEDIPDGMGESTLQLEWRRIKQFFDPSSNMNKLTPWKREQQWVNILEGIHHKEAKVLTAVKDIKLLEVYPQLEKLMKPLGITEYAKPKKARAKRKTKKV